MRNFIKRLNTLILVLSIIGAVIGTISCIRDVMYGWDIGGVMVYGNWSAVFCCTLIPFISFFLSALVSWLFGAGFKVHLLLGHKK